MPVASFSPDAILELENLSGTVADIIDDPDAPDTLWLTVVDARLDTVCRVSFPAPSGSLTDTQEFRLWVRKEPGTGIPQIEISLYEQGTFLQTILPPTNVTSDVGQLFVVTWDYSILSDKNGRDVECYIYGHNSGGTPEERASVAIGAVEWNATYLAGFYLQTLSSVGTSYPVLSTLMSYPRTFSVAEISVPSVLKSVRMALAILTPATPTLNRRLWKAIEYISSVQPRLSSILLAFQALSSAISSSAMVSLARISLMRLYVTSTGRSFLTSTFYHARILAATIISRLAIKPKLGRRLSVMSSFLLLLFPRFHAAQDCEVKAVSSLALNVVYKEAKPSIQVRGELQKPLIIRCELID